MLLKLTEDLYTVTSARVRLGQKLSPRFMSFSGVCQGCVLAPALFCAAIDFIVEHVSHNCGISISNAWFSDLEYADDVVLLADWRELLVSELQSIEEESSEFGLHVSWAKTKVQNMGAGPDAQDLVVNGHIVYGVSKFIYLNSKQSSRVNSSAECVRRIALACCRCHE